MQKIMVVQNLRINNVKDQKLIIKRKSITLCAMEETGSFCKGYEIPVSSELMVEWYYCLLSKMKYRRNNSWQ